MRRSEPGAGEKPENQWLARLFLGAAEKQRFETWNGSFLVFRSGGEMNPRQERLINVS